MALMRTTSWVLDGHARVQMARRVSLSGPRCPMRSRTSKRRIRFTATGTRNTVRAITVAHAAPTSSSLGMCSAAAIGVAHANTGGAGPGP